MNGFTSDLAFIANIVYWLLILGVPSAFCLVLWQSIIMIKKIS